MGQIITTTLSGRPESFTYQGNFFRKVAEDFDSVNFSPIIVETFGLIDEFTTRPAILSEDVIHRLDNTSGDDLISVYVQAPEYNKEMNIAIVDPFMDANIISITTTVINEQTTLVFNNLHFTEPGATQQIRLKGLLYDITFYGFDDQTDVVGSSAFNIKPTTEALIKTQDYNLIVSMDGGTYIDLISSVL